MVNKWKVRPVDMCIYIDEHAYTEDFDEERIYGYLQWLFYSLAHKKKYFRVFEDYDNYATYAAAQTYLRLTDKRQFLPFDNPKKLNKIDSILNFIKTVMYPLKVNYQKSNFNEVIKIDEDQEYKGEDVFQGMSDQLNKTVESANRGFIESEVKLYMNRLSKVIAKEISLSPYCKDKIMKHRLYMSCLLSIIRSFTLSRANDAKLKTAASMRNVSMNFVSKLYNKETSEAPICWRLSDDYLPYIQVLITRIRKEIAYDIKNIVHDYEPNENILQDILMGPLAEAMNGENK